MKKKKITFGTSDAWSMRESSHRPIDPVYYIEDCQILCRGMNNKTAPLELILTHCETRN